MNEGKSSHLHVYFIVYRYLHSASHGVSQAEALSVHFSSRKKVRLKARERDEERGADTINERKVGGRSLMKMMMSSLAKSRFVGFFDNNNWGQGCSLKQRSRWMPDVCKVTKVHKMYIMDNFIDRSEWTSSPSVHARLHLCLEMI